MGKEKDYIMSFFSLPFFFFINEHFNKEITKYVEIIVCFFHLYKLKRHLPFPVGHGGFLGQVVTLWTSRYGLATGSMYTMQLIVNCRRDFDY